MKTLYRACRFVGGTWEAETIDRPSLHDDLPNIGRGHVGFRVTTAHVEVQAYPIVS
jgi:hypothetical protein